MGTPGNKSQEAHNWGLEVCQASSIHGMPYAARRDLHWSERLFWLAMVVVATYYAVDTCLAQWQRFRNNPIVYEYEYLSGLRNFTFLGLTLCTNYETPEQVDMLTKMLVYD